jgi:hypothetical protein
LPFRKTGILHRHNNIAETGMNRLPPQAAHGAVSAKALPQGINPLPLPLQRHTSEQVRLNFANRQNRHRKEWKPPVFPLNFVATRHIAREIVPE